MYQVLDKDTIKKEILPHLSTAQRVSINTYFFIKY